MKNKKFLLPLILNSLLLLPSFYVLPFVLTGNELANDELLLAILLLGAFVFLPIWNVYTSSKCLKNEVPISGKQYFLMTAYPFFLTLLLFFYQYTVFIYERSLQMPF